MTAITMEMGAELAPKKEPHLNIGTSSTVQVGVVVALCGMLASGVWWARGIESNLIRQGERITAIEASTQITSSTNLTVQAKLARIEALLETAIDRLQRLERGDRRGALSPLPNP